MADPNVSVGDRWAVSVGRLRYDLYYLVTVLLGSDRYSWYSEYLALGELLEEFEQDAVDHALITLAIRARVLLDRYSPRLEVTRQRCGTLIADVQHPEAERTLTFREACNKIVHAASRRFEPDEDHQFLGSEVVLEGVALDRRRWRATLSAFELVKAILVLTKAPPPAEPTTPSGGAAVEQADGADEPEP